MLIAIATVMPIATDMPIAIATVMPIAIITDMLIANAMPIATSVSQRLQCHSDFSVAATWPDDVTSFTYQKNSDLITSFGSR